MHTLQSITTAVLLEGEKRQGHRLVFKFGWAAFFEDAADKYNFLNKKCVCVCGGGGQICCFIMKPMSLGSGLEESVSTLDCINKPGRCGCLSEGAPSPSYSIAPY